jgi:hypothetical protein
MICLRCGYCCKKYFVAIVNDPSKGITDKNIIIQTGDNRCKHLVGTEVGKYSCAIHDYTWYKETPCYQFDQVGKIDAPCRIGVYQLSKVN